MTAPITLNNKWITAARFAVLLAPALDKSAVIQVPMFCPSVIKIAERQFTMPRIANVCKYQQMLMNSV